MPSKSTLNGEDLETAVRFSSSFLIVCIIYTYIMQWKYFYNVTTYINHLYYCYFCHNIFLVYYFVYIYFLFIITFLILSIFRLLVLHHIRLSYNIVSACFRIYLIVFFILLLFSCVKISNICIFRICSYSVWWWYGVQVMWCYLW